MDKSGQITLEYLSVYIYMALAVVLVVGALSYFDVLDIKSFVKEDCEAGVQLVCVDAQIVENGNISIMLRNQLRNPVTLTGFNITKDDTLLGGGPLNNYVPPSQISVLQTLTSRPYAAGDKESITFAVSYRPQGSAQTYVVRGSALIKVITSDVQSYVCVPDCVGKMCGNSDGCGGVCDGLCPVPTDECQAGVCVCIDEDALTTCTNVGAVCGNVTNNCGHNVTCGTCTPPDTCDTSTHTCLPPGCSCDGKECGDDDGCGSPCVVACPGIDTCEEKPVGSGVYMCVCDDSDTSDDCAGLECGDSVDDCGNFITCPDTCVPPETCSGNTCSCTPDPFATTCSAVECGNTTNNCLQNVDCGGCPGSDVCVANQCLPNLPQPQALSSYWPFDGNYDDIIGGRDGTPVNGASITSSGLTNQGLLLDGTNDYVDVGTFSIPGTQLSLAAWFKITSFPSDKDPRIISKGTGTTDQDWTILIERDDGSAEARMPEFRLDHYPATRVGRLYDENAKATAGNWHHLAGTFNSGVMSLYFDGHLVKQENQGGILPQNTHQVWIGAQPTVASDRPFPGTLDEVLIYNTSLSAADIAVLYAQKDSHIPRYADIVSWWRMDNGFTDSIGSNNGVNHGAVFTMDAHAGGNAGDFDGSYDYVDAGTFSVGGSAMTIAVWIRANDIEGCLQSDLCSQERIISKAEGDQADDHVWMVSTWVPVAGGQTRLRFRLDTGTRGSTQTHIATSGDINNDRWYHVAAVYDGSSVRLYQDGALVYSGSQSGNIVVDNAMDVWIGNNPPNEYASTARPWDGQIDELFIYDVALTQTEVQQLMQFT